MAAGDWQKTVLDFLVDRYAHVRGDEWRARLAAGDVVDDDGQPVFAGDACRPYRRLHYFRSVPQEPVPAQEETLVYRDERIAVFDKPHGMAVVPAGRHLQQTLLARVRRRLGCDAATAVHRIDRDTAGLVLFSLEPASRDAYHALFRERRVDKLYEAVAGHDPGRHFPLLCRSCIRESAAAFMQMTEVPGAEPNAETRISLLAVLDAGLQARPALHAHYALRPTTGARHQLRLQMAGLGLPIVNDRIYPLLQPDAAGDADALAREQHQPLQLLARRLAFVDPVSGRALAFASERRLSMLASQPAGAGAGGASGTGVAAPAHSTADGAAGA